ncbi:MAG: hypothetical protein KH416_09250 [Dialister sp.]|uniref:hypothetical protein n=1 Tax=Dialister sp. TaxID=1955814 RepID=UPI00257CF702|nr:hypothetical protein [Dialister sp.]MBS6296294.1 hypothetical protein [Dialister sp.]
MDTALVDAVIPLAFILYSALLSMSSPVKVPVVIRFFSFSAWLSMTAPLKTHKSYK